MKPERVAWVSALVACAALLAAPWRGHVDDFDAQLYRVVARNLARAHAWFDLRGLPTLHPVFREHLPFGFWPAAAAIRVGPERAIDPLYALMTLGAIAASGAIARRLAGDRAGVAAILLLGTCESIWQYGGRLLLDPPLLLFATASAGMALAGRWGWAAGPASHCPDQPHARHRPHQHGLAGRVGARQQAVGVVQHRWFDQNLGDSGGQTAPHPDRARGDRHRRRLVTRRSADCRGQPADDRHGEWRNQALEP